MLGRGQQQDSIFDIIEKGNFVGPASNETDELHDTPKKWKRVLKIGLIVALIVFLIYGLYSLFGRPVRNDVFTDAFFQDVESIGLYGGESMLSGEDMQPVIRHLKGLRLTHSDIILTNIGENGEPLAGGYPGMGFHKSDGTATAFLTDGNVITFADGSSYTVNDKDLYSTLLKYFKQPENS